MDIEEFRRMQDSAWVREQRDRMASGQVCTCPVNGCNGDLESYDVEELREPPNAGIPTPGGVRCNRCGARSRAVAL